MTQVVMKILDAEVGVAGKKILSNVNMTINQGELHVLLGPNGSGKTTLLSSIAGIPPYKLSKGKVILQGEDITELPPHERVKKGLVLAYQNPPQFKGLSVRDFLEELRRKIRKDHQYEEQLKKALNIDGFLRKELFSGMSGGERKRLETFITLLMKPTIALLDEPDSGVDIDSVNNIVEALKIALSKGVSLLVVTHSVFMLELLRPLVSRAHVIYAGTLLYSGLYDEVVPLVSRYGFGGAAKTFLKQAGGSGR